MEEKPLSILFLAGDPSGDEHAAAIIRRLHTVLPEARTFGIGGPCMRAQGFEQLMPFEPFNRMGFAEVLLHLPFFLRAKSYLVKQLRERKPAALVCVDFPGFNIPLMKTAKRMAIPVIWYIVPQVWAWKKKRAAVLGANASFIAVVFPFEEAYFKPFAAPVSFVGHPLVELLGGASVAGAKVAVDRNGPIALALVPGSRHQEIVRMLPPMIDAAMILRQAYPKLTVRLSKCRGLPDSLFTAQAERFTKRYPGSIEVSDEPLFSLVCKCDCAIVTSGTATLQTALCGVPLVIAYRTSAATFSLMKSMVKLPFIGLPNIVAGERIVPECIQDDASGRRLAEEIGRFLESKDLYQSTAQKLSGLRQKLGGRRPSVEVAAAIRDIVMRGEQGRHTP